MPSHLLTVFNKRRVTDVAPRAAVPVLRTALTLVLTVDQSGHCKICEINNNAKEIKEDRTVFVLYLIIAIAALPCTSCLSVCFGGLTAHWLSHLRSQCMVVAIVLWPFIVLPHWNAMSQAQDMDTLSRHSIQTQGRPVAGQSINTLEATTTYFDVLGPISSINNFCELPHDTDPLVQC